MAVPWKKVAIAAGVGAGHSGLAYLDGRMGWGRTFRRSQDWLHLGIWGLGLWKGMKGTMGETLETAMIADTPLVVKSVLAFAAPEIGRRIGQGQAVAEAQRILMTGRRVGNVGQPSTRTVPGEVPLPTDLEIPRASYI